MDDRARSPSSSLGSRTTVVQVYIEQESQTRQQEVADDQRPGQYQRHYFIRMAITEKEMREDTMKDYVAQPAPRNDPKKSRCKLLRLIVCRTNSEIPVAIGSLTMGNTRSSRAGATATSLTSAVWRK